MQISEIVIAGDTQGIDWRVPVLQFDGKDEAAPSVYIQAALHANELPGTALLHFLCERLRRAEAAGDILGDITVVPQANPIGAAQAHFGGMQGRFDLGSRTNFNRDFPLVGLGERQTLLDGLEALTAIDRLKRHLLHTALGADLVLDLHCDDESLQYAYIDEAFWPEAADLAAALGLETVFLADGESSAFEEAVGHAWKYAGEEKAARLPGRLSATLELRGTRDVYPAMAQRDADGLFEFLGVRGVVRSDAGQRGPFAGPAVPLDNVEMIRTPVSGTVLFHRDIGDTVEAGDLLATILTAPGMEAGTVELRAPQSGLIVTRSSARFARRSDSLMKIAGSTKTAGARKPGTLEV
ncbi:succinylglutamate desuccinylase/aspartoacylase domain-containing protein [Pararhizobium gei]|uniref:succinylglutamate desuccinylase/aspartoacylase domain-containing protein n=1 Tax=Pararhizobium gei TaxID=1395951 RepID=UPI0023DC15FB|nr:succinylglutamate desuccinylase/aspartoacylase family protein [Rhizobium gei]